MEILNMSSQEFIRRQLQSHHHQQQHQQFHTGTVRSIKRKNHKPILSSSDDNYSTNSTNSVKSSSSITSGKSIQPIKKGAIVVNLTKSLNDESSRKTPPIVWNTSGWIRVYCGPDRSEITCEDPSRMVHVVSNATTMDVIKDMDLPEEYTIWIQIGGALSRRLNANEQPFIIQEEFLKRLGYLDESRRSRLGIDPDLKYLIRFHIGPAELVMCKGISKSGTVEILKGLVFPQWRRRSIALIGSKLIIFPANTCLSPETFELAGAEIFEHSPGYNRLILKIVPKLFGESISSTRENLCGPKQTEVFGNNSNNYNIYHSTTSLSSNNGDKDKVLFFGFEESWERDLWSTWLVEASSEVTNYKRMDIGGSGLQTIPEIVLQSTNIIEELLAGQNKLQEIALQTLSEFSHLKVLRLPGNGFKTFPEPLLNIYGLTVLDLADNEIEFLPENICDLINLEELKIDRNGLIEIPNSVKRLKNLKSLQLSQNQIQKLPSFLINMRTLGLVDMYAQKSEFGKILNHGNRHENSADKNDLNPPLSKVNLRANQLKGSIILGNYGYLTQLDVSENAIEVLDLSALDKLESLQCSRNRLSELAVNGRVLNSLIAGNNFLTKLIVLPVPSQLRHLDVSYNSLIDLPDWLSGCHQLRTLFASNNQIASLPDHLFCSERGSLHTVQLGYNCLKSLPDMPRRKLPLQELFLQSNKIDDLPESFFHACGSLTLLNVSSNKLMTLPIIDGAQSQLERLYITDNELTDRVLDTLIGLLNLKILHAAYNRLTTFPESCVSNWPDLEELVLSGNRLQHLPENLANLKNIKILRVHSNQLRTVPALSKTNSLRVLDLAHNHLDKINLVSLVPKKLQFLDLSCNTQLQVDPKQLQACKSQRAMSLVDVSGKNRASLPSTPSNYQEHTDYDPPWLIGFSETAGNCSKLYISQLRLPGFCNSEGLFGMFDGELNNIVPNLLTKAIPKILLEERTVKETASDYLKYTLLSAHRELKQHGQKHGVSVTLCHISRNRIVTDNPNYLVHNGRRFILRVASVGESSAVLIRQLGNVKLTPSTPKRQIGNSASFPLIIPDPEVSEVTLGDQDEYLVIANKKLWEVMDPDAVAVIIKTEQNVILAAKRVQDIAQSYGAEENLSIIVIKFNNLGTDMDFVMKELRQTIRKKPSGGSVIASFCKCGCCCESNNSCCHSGAMEQFVRQSSGRSDRSSPSGQSDQTASELNGHPLLPQKQQRVADTASVASRRSSNYATNERRSLRGGVVRAVRARIEEEREKEKEESDSAMSEEQFKCWEYMLEQNTQLLFDKELNTISRSFTKRPFHTNLTRSQIKALSSSSPQLAMQDHNPRPVYSHYHNMATASNISSSTTNVPFLSKHFGSARSFHPQTQGLFKAMRFNSGRVHPISGGPNAAYFGSLQRLMPYNLEYDFAVMQERGGEDDSLEPDGRMQQYWGVATTEL